MDEPGRQRWLIAAILAGVLYLVVGVAFAALAGVAASRQMVFFWRLSAYVVSAAVFAAHISREHFRLRATARTTAWHASVGVALGGLALALVANIHDLGSAAGYRPKMLIALVAWPVLTAVPAFIVALVATAGLGAKQRGVQASKP